MTWKHASLDRLLLFFSLCIVCGSLEAQEKLSPQEECLREVKIALDDKSLLKFMADFSGAKDIEKIKALIKQLDSPRFKEREDAQRLLLAQGSRAVPFLKEAQKGANTEAARRIQDCLIFLDDRRERFYCAIRVLVARGNKDVAPVLWNSLDETDHTFNRIAQEHLEKLVKPGDLPAVIEKAKCSPSLGVRACAVSLLNKFPGHADEILPVVAERLRTDKSPAVRTRAVNVLRWLAWNEKRKEAIPLLVEALDDFESEPGYKDTVGARAAAYLGIVGDKSVLPALIKAAKSSNEDLQWGAVKGLKLLAENHPIVARDIFPVFEKNLHDSSQPLVARISAIICLPYMDEEGLGHIIKLLGDRTPRIRDIALHYLRDLGPKARKAVPQILIIVNDPREKELFRIDAIKALGRIGGEAARAGLSREFETYYLNYHAKLAIKTISTSNK